MRYAVSALITVIILSSLLLTASSPPAYVGEWELDPVNNSDIADLYTLFGSSLRQFGAKLTVRSDGRIEYYIGLWGGAGTYKVIDNTVVADLMSYNDPHPYKASFSIVTEGSKTYLVYRFDNGITSALIWWTKKE